MIHLCLTWPTQSHPPWSHIKERWHHTRPDDWKPTWNQTHRKTKNHLAEGPHYTSKHQLRGSVDSFPERVQYDDIGMIMNKNGLVCDQKEQGVHVYIVGLTSSLYLCRPTLIRLHSTHYCRALNANITFWYTSFCFQASVT